MKLKFIKILKPLNFLLLVLPVLFTANASLILEGDFVKTAISDNGTLGYGNIIAPGLLYDPTGTRANGS